MKKLTEYTRNGYQFNILDRIGNAAFFHGVNKNGAKTWEGIHIQSHNGREVNGTHCPPSEYPPSNEQWGSKGFTFTSRELSMQWLESQTTATP